MVLRRWLLIVLAATSLTTWAPAFAQEPRRIEVVEVKGIIDNSVEHAITGAIRQAEEDDVEMMVLQMDSSGVTGAGRTERIAKLIAASRVPIATWIGPAGAGVSNGAVVVALSAPVRAASPTAAMGPLHTLNLRSGRSDVTAMDALVRATPARTQHAELFNRPLTADLLDELEVIDYVVGSVAELLKEVDGERVDLNGTNVTLSTDPSEVLIRFHKLDLMGRVLHAAAQPSITYLLLLLGLVGVVFELFHPSTGPAGVAGLAGLALAVYGVVTLGGSWLGFALIVAGVAGFAVDLRFQSLGPLTAVGFGALVAGSLLLFNGPWLRASPWVLGFGIAGMVAFLLGAMTRVLRDLRAVARGELEVRDAHPHPNGDHA